MVLQSTTTLASAAVLALAFTATAPIASGSGSRPIRVGLGLVLIPLLWQVAPQRRAAGAIESILWSAIVGAALGLAASVVALAVKAAGDTIDAALGSPPFITQASQGGPIERLYQLAYAVVLFDSGGFTVMVAALAHANAGLAGLPLNGHGLAALANASLRGSLLLAGPSLFAQALATIAAGLFARAAPGLGGMLFGASFPPAFVLLALIAGSGVLLPEIVAVVRESAALSSARW